MVIRLGVIGYGYWGPNVVRNFATLAGSEVVVICDPSPAAAKRARIAFPHIHVTSEAEEALTSPTIDAIAVVTPVSTHYKLAKRALENGKHVFVEKPFTETVAQAEELIELAERKGLQIMVDHTFIFTGAVRKIKQLIDGGDLGKVYYYDSVRVNLGLLQHDVNVIWDLAAHDFAIISYLFDEAPAAVVACGRSHVGSLADIGYLTLLFNSNLIAHVSVNWLSPVKVRTTLIGGEKKMLVWNDLESDEKLKIYDKGVEIVSTETQYQMLVNYRTGDMLSPRLEQGEALKAEAALFVDCINTGKRPPNDGVSGLRVVKLLTACDESLRRHGAEVHL
jgi:predicted dehydrogenase